MADRVFTDPEGFGPAAFDLLDDPFELAACALWLASFNTPEDAAILLGNRPKAWKAWASDGVSAAWKAKDRHLYRRRAALALDGRL